MVLLLSLLFLFCSIQNDIIARGKNTQRKKILLTSCHCCNRQKGRRQCAIVRENTTRLQACDTNVVCNIRLKDSINPNFGNVLKGNDIFIHNFGLRSTFVGKNSGNFESVGENNTGFGEHALQNNIDGNKNTAIGIDTLSARTNVGDENTALGYKAFVGVESVDKKLIRGGGGGGGVSNTAIGAFAFMNNETGGNNTVVGAHAGKNNSDGIANTFIGTQSGTKNTGGRGNTAVGEEALKENINGNDNVAVGLISLLRLFEGSNNIAIGAEAGFFLESGSNNIYIGTPESEQVESNKIRIGLQNIHEETHIAGIFQSAIENEGIPVFIDNTGKLGTLVSSQRFKKNIQKMEINEALLGKILALTPVLFSYIHDKEQQHRQLGLIAEEVAQIFPELVIYDDNGSPLSLRYDLLSVLTIAALKKMSDDIREQKERIDRLEQIAIFHQKQAVS